MFMWDIVVKIQGCEKKEFLNLHFTLNCKLLNKTKQNT